MPMPLPSPPMVVATFEALVEPPVDCSLSGCGAGNNSSSRMTVPSCDGLDVGQDFRPTRVHVKELKETQQHVTALRIVDSRPIATQPSHRTQRRVGDPEMAIKI